MKSKFLIALGLSISILSLSACAADGGRTARRNTPSPAPYQGQNIIQTSPNPAGFTGVSPAPGGMMDRVQDRVQNPNGILGTSPNPNGALNGAPNPNGILGGITDPNGRNGASPAPGGTIQGVPGTYGGAGALNATGRLCPQGMNADRTRAENIKAQLQTMREINDVNVVCAGNTVLVSYRPSPASTDPNATRNMVASRCKQIDNRVASVTCTDAPDITPEVARLENDVDNNLIGNDVSGRFNELVRRVVPNAR